MSTHIPVSTLTVGTVVLDKRGAAHTVMRLQPLPRSGRVRVWVKGNRQAWSRVSESNFGQYAPTDTVEVP
jgi:hypothetical protein